MSVRRVKAFELPSSSTMHFRQRKLVKRGSIWNLHPTSTRQVTCYRRNGRNIYVSLRQSDGKGICSPEPMPLARAIGSSSPPKIRCHESLSILNRARSCSLMVATWCDCQPRVIGERRLRVRFGHGASGCVTHTRHFRFLGSARAWNLRDRVCRSTYRNEYVVDAPTSFILAARTAHAETKSGR